MLTRCASNVNKTASYVQPETLYYIGAKTALMSQPSGHKRNHKAAICQNRKFEFPAVCFGSCVCGTSLIIRDTRIVFWTDAMGSRFVWDHGRATVLQPLGNDGSVNAKFARTAWRNDTHSLNVMTLYHRSFLVVLTVS